MRFADNEGVQPRAFERSLPGKSEGRDASPASPQPNELGRDAPGITPRGTSTPSHLTSSPIVCPSRSGLSPRKIAAHDAVRRIHAPPDAVHVGVAARGRDVLHAPANRGHLRAARPAGAGHHDAVDTEVLLARLGEIAERSREHDGEAMPPVIVVIGERVLVRDCLVQCLQFAYTRHAVLAFPTLSVWLEQHGDGPLPSVVLLFTQGRRRNGSNPVDEIEMLGKISLSVPVIVVSDIEDGDRIMQALEKGIRGYIPTSMAFSVAIEAVRLVEAGGTFVPVSSLLAARRDSAANGNNMFTARQIMVVEALHRGKANKQIAYELNMRESTVKVHIRHIMKKLNARNRTEVAVMTSSLFDDHLDDGERPETSSNR